MSIRNLHRIVPSDGPGSVKLRRSFSTDGVRQ